jgi:hypothetical protein
MAPDDVPLVPEERPVSVDGLRVPDEAFQEPEEVPS